MSTTTTTEDAGAPASVSRAAMVLRASIVLVVALALVMVELTSRSGVAWRLTTFTYQAGVAAAAFHAWALVSRTAAGRPGLRGAVTLYVLVAGLVWNVFLVEVSMGYTPANMLLHIVLPVLVLVEWMVVGREQSAVRQWHPLAWLLYPLAYLVLALLVLNEAGRRAPYPFLDPEAVGAATVAGNVCLLALGFVSLGYVLALLGWSSVAVRGAWRRRGRPV